MRLPPRLAGMAELADRAETFLLDQYGVLHDGHRPYPGAVECLRRLAEAGRRLVVLSNSGKRAAENRERLARIGLPPECLAAVVTSGELTWRLLQERRDPWLAGLGRRCQLFTRGGDRSVVEGLDLALVEEAAEADFVLLAGCDIEPGDGPDDYRQRLRPALDRRLPLICANPDRVRVGPNGLAGSPGALAAWYEAEGGPVRWLGKPYPEIYALALQGSEGGTALAVGDSLEHDIAGAAAVGLPTVLALGGVHSGADEAALRRLFRGHRCRPDWLLPAFRW